MRKTVVEWLDSKGLLRGTQDNEMSVPLCSRSKDIIEPVLKPQWWVSCQGMAQEGIKAAQDGRLQIIPSEFEATWYRYVHGWCMFSDMADGSDSLDVRQVAALKLPAGRACTSCHH